MAGMAQEKPQVLFSLQSQGEGEQKRFLWVLLN